MRMRGSRAVLAALCLTVVTPLAGQETQALDRILAVVGNHAILASQVDEEFFARFPGGKGVPHGEDSLRLRKDIISSLISEELMVQEAQRDTTIKISDEQVNSAVDETHRSVRAKYTAEEDFRKDLQIAGFQTLDEWRSWEIDRQRRTFYVNRLKEKEFGGKVKNVIPTDAEMRQYYEQNKAQLPKQAARISVRWIAIAPRATAEARAKAKALADSIVGELRKGGEFAAAAKRFSQDPGSKEQGGDLGWFRRGIMVPEFERVAFYLKPGVVSDPVETPFGFHLIQVQRLQPAEVNARHILITPVVDSVHADSAKMLANQLFMSVKAGVNFDSLQRLYHDPAEEKELQDFPVDKLPPTFTKGLEGVPAGGVAPVFMLPAADPLRSKYVVAKVTSRAEAGDAKFEEVRDQIRKLLGEQLAIQRYIERLRQATYVEIRGS